VTKSSSRKLFFALRFAPEMNVLFFAQIRDFTGCASTSIETRDAANADALWSVLEQQFRGIGKFRGTTRLARNGVFAASDELFADADEIALIPPVSGG
jgi:molybdopterin converting factor small subunit